MVFIIERQYHLDGIALTRCETSTIFVVSVCGYSIVLMVSKAIDGLDTVHMISDRRYPCCSGTRKPVS